MDQTVTIEELKKRVQSFCEARDWDQFHTPKDLAIGISTEANELLDIFRFQSEEQMRFLLADSESRNHIQEELADTLFFLLRFAQLHGIDLETALNNKMEQNGKRYTIEKSKGKNEKIH